MEKTLHEIMEENVLKDGGTPFIPKSAIQRKCWETVVMQNLLGVASSRSGRAYQELMHDDTAIGMKQIGWQRDGGGRAGTTLQCNGDAMAMSKCRPRPRQHYFRKPVATAQPRRGGSTTAQSYYTNARGNRIKEYYAKASADDSGRAQLKKPKTCSSKPRRGIRDITDRSR
jgi:hypothetical protein